MYEWEGLGPRVKEVYLPVGNTMEWGILYGGAGLLRGDDMEPEHMVMLVSIIDCLEWPILYSELVPRGTSLGQYGEEMFMCGRQDMDEWYLCPSIKGLLQWEGMEQWDILLLVPIRHILIQFSVLSNTHLLGR